MDPLRPVAGPPSELVPALERWLGATAEPDPLVVETSGSTGAPKRVVLSRRAVLASVRGTARRLGGQGRWLLALPPTYVAGLLVLCRSLVAGHQPLLADDPRDVAAALAGAPADGPPLFVSLVPTQLHRLLAQPSQVAALRRCHHALVGGGPVPAVLRERAREAGVTVVATYGSAETAGGCVYDGRPLDGVELDLERDGRIRIAGPMLFDRYAGDPALTAGCLVDGWFRTADAGRFEADGRLRVLGRLDDVVVSGGVNVPLPAVAERLREHPAISDAAVVGVPDEQWGQRVVALLVARSPGTGQSGAGLPELRDWVAEAQPRAWAPREVRYVTRLPLLPNGKLDRVRLQALVAAPGGAPR